MQCYKINMDNYQFYLLTRVRCFKSSEQDLTGEVLYSLGASIGLGDGDLDGCTSCDGDSNDDVTFSFHTSLVYGLVFGIVGSSFMASTSSSFFGS